MIKLLGKAEYAVKPLRRDMYGIATFPDVEKTGVVAATGAKFVIRCGIIDHFRADFLVTTPRVLLSCLNSSFLRQQLQTRQYHFITANHFSAPGTAMGADETIHRGFGLMGAF